MMKRFSAVICAISLIFSTSICVFAISNYSLIDDANLFSHDEISELSKSMNELGEKTGWEIVVYTNENYITSDEMTAFYNNFYDNNNFRDSGIMFVIDCGYNNRVIVSEGEAIDYFTDDRMEQLKSELLIYLANDDYYSATNKFIEVVDFMWSEGIPSEGNYSNYYDPTEESDSFLSFLTNYGWIIVIVAIVFATVTVVFISLRYKNHGKKGTYDLEANSITNITQCEDIFVRKSVVVTTEQVSDNDYHSSSSDIDSCGSSGSF